jgi:sortase (surface protein transpeptidase)
VKPGGSAWRRMALGILIPALAAGLVAFALVPRPERAAPIELVVGQAEPPAKLARMAATAPLRPIVLRGDSAELGNGAAGPATPEDRPAEPARLSIPTLDVRADVQRVASTETGIEVPQVGRAGWFDEGPRPGEPGRAVVIGHLDSHDGPGLFALLPGVQPGTAISIRDASGDLHRFEVVGKAQVTKATFPSGAVYGPSDRPVLVLITCGGPYDPATGYRDNVIVYARSVA